MSLRGSGKDVFRFFAIALIAVLSFTGRARAGVPTDIPTNLISTWDDPGTWPAEPDPEDPLTPVDPGVRDGPPGAGSSFPGLTTPEVNFYLAGQEAFEEVDSVRGTLPGENGVGLGPTFNANSCAACHAAPAAGGTSPTVNPQVGFATLDRVSGGNQTVPSFITINGPVREARFIRNPDGSLDGGVHGLYTIAGRTDAPGCNLSQPNFAAQLAAGNVIFRIPTPTFGLGLIENVPDDELVANVNSNSLIKAIFGIGGKLNRTGNDGTVTRFGWKAQNKSLEIFAGEAYNVEQGVSNELFPNERSTVAGCEFNSTPEDKTNLTGTSAGSSASDTVLFAGFMRLSAPPTPAAPTPSSQNGHVLFIAIGCGLCHTEMLTTRASPFTGMGNFAIHPFSDIALHHMGPGLADFINQGNAGFDEFRTAPLWGVGKRNFFLHDGRTSSLLNAILAHRSHNPSCAPGQVFAADGTACNSEANTTVNLFLAVLSSSQQQDIINFLRSL